MYSSYVSWLASLTTLKSNLVGLAWQNCDRAIRAGLSPPPGRLKRSVTGSYRLPQKVISRRTPVHARTIVNAQNTSMEMVFAEASLHIWITFLFWFCVSISLITQAKTLGKIMFRSYRMGHYRNWLYILYLVLTINLTAIFMVTVVNAHSRWVDRKRQEALEQYCRSARVRIGIFCINSLRR
jgi:hypothetical protein